MGSIYQQPIRKYTNGYETWWIDRHPHRDVLRDINQCLHAFPEEQLVILHDGTIVMFITDLDLLNKIEKEMKLIRILITLDDLKKRPLNPKTVEIFNRTCELAPHNIFVMRHWLYEDEDGPERCTYNLTRNGNDRKPSSQLLDDARMYIEKNVYTDEEWEKWFIPAINDVLDYNACFIRWMPGYVIRNKKDLKLYIVEYDYATAFGQGCPYECTDYQNLALCTLDSKDGHITGSWAWANYNDYELIDKEHTEENIEKIRDYHRGTRPPYHLRKEMLKLYY